MRRACHGNTDWVDIPWKGAVMAHPVQQDGCSCGVIVIKVSGNTTPKQKKLEQILVTHYFKQETLRIEFKMAS